MKKSEKSPKTRIKIAYVMGLVVSVMFLFVVIVSSVLTTNRTKYIMERMLGAILVREVEIIESSLQDYQALPWLLDYWQQHADEMEKDYTKLRAKKNVVFDEYRSYSMSDPREITAEEAKAMKPAGQQLFADICYLTCAEAFDFFDDGTAIFFECFRREGDREFTYFIDRSWVQETVMEGVLSYTEVSDSDAVYYEEELRRTMEDPDAYPQIFQLGENDSESLVVFKPVFRDGEQLCILMEMIPWNNVTTLTWEAQKYILPPIFILFIAACGILILLLHLTIVRPLEMIQRTMHEYAETKQSSIIPERLDKLLNGRSELGILSMEFLEMAVNIDCYVEETTLHATEKERYKSEMGMAARIQESQLPREFPAFPDRKDFDLYASMNPARDVGGDFYDFFLLDDDHLALVIGDVSDKGIPAALIMMVCKALIRGGLKRREPLAETMRIVNRQLAENNTMKMFVTAWVLVIELSTGKGIEINAGHERPAIRRAGGEFELIMNKHNMALGALAGTAFTEHPFEMKPGDTLFVYSDGVPESTDANKELFGNERMLAALNDDPDASPEQQITHMKEAIAGFVGEAEQFDDMTMLCFTMCRNEKEEV